MVTNMVIAYTCNLGSVSIYRCCMTSIGIPVFKIRRLRDRLIFNTGISYLGQPVIHMWVWIWSLNHCEHISQNYSYDIDMPVCARMISVLVPFWQIISFTEYIWRKLILERLLMRGNIAQRTHLGYLSHSIFFNSFIFHVGNALSLVNMTHFVNMMCTLHVSNIVSIRCSDFIISAMASQITSVSIVHSTVYLGADKKKY